MPPGAVLAGQLALDHQRALVFQDLAHAGGFSLLGLSMSVIPPVAKHGFDPRGWILFQGRDNFRPDIVIVDGGLHDVLLWRAPRTRRINRRSPNSDRKYMITHAWFVVSRASLDTRQEQWQYLSECL